MEVMTLRQIRLAKEISQEAMASQLINENGKPIHVNTYARWEEKPSQISIEFCYKICGILGIEYDSHIFLP